MFITNFNVNAYDFMQQLFDNKAHEEYSLLLTLTMYLFFCPHLPGKAAPAGSIPSSIPETKSVPLASDGEKGCESCHCIVASRWYQWGPVHEHCRLCNFCYTYWRKYGGLKLPTKWGVFAQRVYFCNVLPKLKGMVWAYGPWSHVKV